MSATAEAVAGTDLQVVTKALTDIDAVSAGLDAMREKYKGVLFPVATPEGMEEAKAARATIREPRYNVENIRKGAKAPLLALGRKLDAEAARITVELQKIEDPIDLQIKNEEGRKDRERQARVDAELKRVQDIQDRIENVRRLVPAAGTADALLAKISSVEAVVIDERFAEFRQMAQDAKDASLGRLQQMHAAAISQEAEAERIRQERAELDRLRAAQAKRDADDQARRDTEDRERKRLQKEEDDRAEVQRRAQRAEEDRQAAERKKILDDQEAAAKIERDRLAAERAELEREKARAVPKPEPAPAATPSRKPRPTAAAMTVVLATHYGVSVESMTKWVRVVDWKADGK